MDRATVLTFPHDDAAFRAQVEAAQEFRGGWNADDVIALVRQAYPAASAHRASSFGLGEMDTARWYVYRDGNVRSRDTAEWWRDASLPTTVMTAQGVYLDANNAAAQLFGCRVEDLIGQRAGTFTRHEQTDVVAVRLFERLNQMGVLHSTAVVLRPDGAEPRIEFHTRREGDVFVTVMRQIGQTEDDVEAAAGQAVG